MHLRYDVRVSSLPPDHKERLLALHDHRITRDGVVVIKAQQFRSLEQNRDEAVRRLHELVRSVATPPRVRRATRPTLASRQRRLEGKSQRSQVKALRGKVFD
ncbi:Peptidyl-tRNA hydrolase ArfB [compost metagenome]